MRLATRLNLLTLAVLVGTSAAVLTATAWLMRDALRDTQARMMRLELQAVARHVEQRLQRAGVAAARSEAAAELQRLRTQPGMASASLRVVEQFDQRVVYHPLLAADAALRQPHVLTMLQRQQGTLTYVANAAETADTADTVDAANTANTADGEPGVARAAEFTTLQPMGWMLALSLSQHEIDAPLRTLLATLGFIGLAGLGCGAMLSQLYARGLSRRLAQLLDGMRRIETGEPGVRLPAQGSDDELRRVEHGLNTLAGHLADHSLAEQTSRAALAASEAQLRQLFEANLIGVVRWRLDGRILDANEAFLALLGLDRSELAAGTLTWQALTPPDDAPLMHRALEQMHQRGRVQPYERHCLHRSGRRVPVMLGSLRVDGSQPPQGLTFVVDMSARAQAEASRRAHHEAAAASRAKSAFLASMSHEIRTPMNAILGLTHLMLRDPALAAPQRNRLGKVDSAARHLLRLINDILDLSKIEAGKLVLEDTEFETDALLQRVVEFVREPAAAKGLALVLDTNHLPPRLRGDPTRLAQMLINLMANAVKFTAHGHVRLRGELLPAEAAEAAKAATPSAATPSAATPAGADALQLRFEVHDTGEGIAPARQQAIFEAFKQADGSTTRRHGGTGLGLPLTRHLAHLMAGEVGLHSVPGQGSCFWVTVRLRRAQPATAARPWTAWPARPSTWC